jgi:UDP-N-acetylglucosamine 4,6-dehydratase
VLDMGEPMHTVDLAKKMIHLSGLEVKDEFNPDGDIEIEFNGLRPGEKLYEELLIGDNVSETDNPMIIRAEEEMLAWDDLKLIID